MKTVVGSMLIILMSLMLCAHFLRDGQIGLVAAYLLLPLLLLPKRKWCLMVVVLGLGVGALVWLITGIQLAAERMASGESWIRAMIIMGSVAIITAITAWRTAKRATLSRYSPDHSSTIAGISAFSIVFILCAFPQIIMHNPVPLLLERFVPGSGWLEIFGLSLYAGWLVTTLIATPVTGSIRKTVWLLFSIVFFSQLILGLSGVQQFLMTGVLHLPIPAIILAGPIYRGDGFFMPILFAVTLLLAGPSWCSWFCYVGAWDNLAAQSKTVPAEPKKNWQWIRVGILVMIIVVALGLRFSGVSTINAVVAALIFGIIGAGVIAMVSRKSGLMTHCTVYCPIGLIAVIAGKINPFRLKINRGCIECGSCTRICRYGALSSENIRNRKVGLNCTLCGDCTASCSGGFIEYHFLAFKGAAVRSAYFVVVVSLHAIFLGFARI